MKDNIGYITQVIGPVVDATFDGEGAQLPPIYNALKIQRPDGSDLIVEVEQHIGPLRCYGYNRRSYPRNESGRFAASVGYAYRQSGQRPVDERDG